MPANKPQTEAALTHTSPVAETAVSQSATPTSTKRGEDFGNVLLPNMDQFQLLARKVKQPARLLQLASHVCDAIVPEPLIQQAIGAKTAMPPKQRTQLYQWLAKAGQQHLSTLEKISTRITALTDTFGHQAVMAMLDLQDEDDMLALEEPTDKWSRALYLYNAQFLGDPQTDSVPDEMFEHAERRQSMNRHWNSKEYASHYLGPKDTEPLPLTQFEHVLREQVAALYPGIPPELIVISHHYSEDLSHNRRLGFDDHAGAARIQHQHTIAATFNATRAQYRLVVG